MSTAGQGPRRAPSSAADAGSARTQVPYTANLTLQLPSGANLTVPVRGTYRGSSYSPVVRLRAPLCKAEAGAWTYG